MKNVLKSFALVFEIQIFLPQWSCVWSKTKKKKLKRVSWVFRLVYVKIVIQLLPCILFRYIA